MKKIGHKSEANAPARSIDFVMDKQTADQLAVIVGGESWEESDGNYVVSVYRDDGSIIFFSGESIVEFENDKAFESQNATQKLALAIPNRDELFVLVDAQGTVLFNDNSMERGWRYREDAEHEARGLQSRGEGSFSVVLQHDIEK